MENKKIITIFGSILILSFLVFWFTTVKVVSEKNKVQAKLEENKEIIIKSERIKFLEKNNEDLKAMIWELDEEIKEKEWKKSLLIENVEKNNWEINDLKNSLVK